MARARNIKPGFFKNELLVEMCAFDRLLFIGLWLLADREGRIEDRPKRIKLELFPCDTYDVDAGLNILAESGFVKRYKNNVKSVISIENFLRHQTPHGSEKDSELPDVDGNLTINNRDRNGYVTGKKRINNVKASNNVKNNTSNGASEVDSRHLPVSNALNPDILNPESLNPESSCANAKQVRFDAASANFDVPSQIREGWMKAYPAVQIDTELAKAAVWVVANPKNKKSNYARFLANWFTKAQDKAPAMGGNGGNKNWSAKPDWVTQAGFIDVADANAARCWQSNASEFHNGKHTEAA